MMRMVKVLTFLILTGGLAMAGNFATLNEAGNKAFEKGNFQEALDLYRQAETERPETPELYYNEANALVETGKYEEAVEKFTKALNTDDITLQARAYYNGGNGFFKKEDFRQAIEWYQKSLELNPDDMDAKYNLELARNRLREQMERQPQDKQQQQQQQQQDQQKQEQKQQEQKPEEQKQDQQQQQQDQQQQQQMEKQQQPDPNEMTEEDALRILRALDDAEKDNQKEQKRFKAQGTYRGKDW
jgi:Ca-activated chloride channel family protein